MLIKDLQSNSVFEYGGCHDSLSISEDGRTLSYYNLQNGDDSEYGDYRFVMEDGKIPAESETADAIYGCSYFDVGGRFNAEKYYKMGAREFAEWLYTKVNIPIYDLYGNHTTVDEILEKWEKEQE